MSLLPILLIGGGGYLALQLLKGDEKDPLATVKEPIRKVAVLRQQQIAAQRAGQTGAATALASQAAALKERIKASMTIQKQARDLETAAATYRTTGMFDMASALDMQATALHKKAATLLED